MLPDWQIELANALTDPHELLTSLNLDARQFPAIEAASADFPFRVTRSYAARMRKGDSGDPLLRQVLPSALELRETAGFGGDPVGDLSSAAPPGMLHKYAGRVLLIATGACAIHCRYCFRRDFPYSEQQLAHSRAIAAMETIARDPSIREVIVSGGDPLALGDERLAELVRSIAAIPHVQRLRLHSRLPVVLPTRINRRLLELLSNSRLRIVMVIHANHGNELDAAVGDAMTALTRHGVTTLNQAVLLKGVNDDEASLIELSEKLFAIGVLPYYLHMLDRARGTAHFEVAETRALSLMDALRRQLPGYLLPQLVREQPGAPYKLPVA
jgi:EF-P beta-lysylation protein EpmB